MSAEKDKKPMIRIRGANVNNLKKISVDIPRNEFVVLTGSLLIMLSSLGSHWSDRPKETSSVMAVSVVEDKLRYFTCESR